MVAVFSSTESSAQFKFRETPNQRTPDRLNDYGEQRLWDDFLNARYLGKFNLVGTLKYRPARNASTLYDFQLIGDWNSAEQISELKLSELNGIPISRKLVIRDGNVATLEEQEGVSKESIVDDTQLAMPLLGNLPFTWNDILMPYFKWDNVTYLGPVRYLGRPAHKFILINDDASAEDAKVIVTLDEDFAVLLKSDVLNKDDTIIKRIRISGFKQFNDEWMFSELVWEHRISRESVLLKVSDFSMNP